MDNVKEYDLKTIRADRFFNKSPFHYSRYYSQKYNCDIAAPNGIGIGNILCYTRLVEEFSLSIGRPIKLLTAPISPASGVVDGESLYPIWENNPFIDKIVNADEIDKEIMKKIDIEQDNYCQFNHVIENICSSYGLRPRKLKPSLFLTNLEMQWALHFLSKYKRPIICLHPSGKSASSSESPWFIDKWLKLIAEFNDMASLFQICKHDYDMKPLSIISPKTTIRQAMALIWASDLFIGFDSSPAHIATAFDIPSLVLWDVIRKNPIEELKQKGFGGAALLRWAYPQNRNLMLLGEKDNEIFELCKEFIIETVQSFYRQNKFLTLPMSQKWMR